MEERNTDMLEMEGMKKKSRKEVVETLLSLSVRNNYAAAVWRMPNEASFQMMVDVNAGARGKKLELDESETGFAVSPFENFNNDNAIFIKNDMEIVEGREPAFSERLTYEEKRELARVINAAAAEDKPFPWAGLIAPTPHQASETEYKAMVNEAVSQFSDERFQKVALSRADVAPLPASFDIAGAFLNLCGRHPAAFVSLVFVPGRGLWIGASPELLIAVEDNIFKTAAVAGTQLHDGARPPAEVAWTQKEIEEQAMVSRYIINCFKKIRLREFEEIGPRTTIAGNLAHLKTDFRVDMAATNFPQLGTVMLELLHPTSAVCGMPRDYTIDFIKKHERYDRSFYSGFLGPVNYNRRTALYVNIRCMQILGETAALYAGAGITHYSDCDKEWEETALKMNTMRSIIYP